MPLPIDSVTGETWRKRKEKKQPKYSSSRKSEREGKGQGGGNKMHACIWLLVHARLGKCYFWKMDIWPCPIRIGFIFKCICPHSPCGEKFSLSLSLSLAFSLSSFALALQVSALIELHSFFCVFVLPSLCPVSWPMSRCSFSPSSSSSSSSPSLFPLALFLHSSCPSSSFSSSPI